MLDRRRLCASFSAAAARAARRCTGLESGAGSAAGEVDAIAFARPGWDARSAAGDIAGNAAAARSVLDAHGVARATVVGHSFSGAVACWLAAQFPERVHALVLAAPAANVASLYGGSLPGRAGAGRSRRRRAS
jgi:pimeloyl-ACP methyl ester carboxylesterase